jgi:hypothetical protein
MRGKGLGLLIAVVVATTLTACQSRPESEEPATATRAEVTLALWRQFRYVRARHEELEADESEAAREERKELERLALEIALRILRVDPDADLEGLSMMIEELPPAALPPNEPNDETADETAPSPDSIESPEQPTSG